MKGMVITFCLIAASTLPLLGQGRVNFNNFASPLGIQPVTLFSDFVGSTYSVQLLWATGTFGNQAAFNTANPSSSAAFAFFGTTGSAPSHGPLIDGAGLFDGGTIAMNGPAGTYTMQARAWFNNGQFATYDTAFSAGFNTGLSQLIEVAVTASPSPAPNTPFPSFTVNFIPEPSTFALVGLGAACLLFFGRKQKS